jgi:hypothetical protein
MDGFAALAVTVFVIPGRCEASAAGRGMTGAGILDYSQNSYSL